MKSIRQFIEDVSGRVINIRGVSPDDEDLDNSFYNVYRAIEDYVADDRERKTEQP